MFQQFNLFPHMTVLENLIEAPVNVQKRDRDEVIKEAEVLLKKVGLSDKRDVYPRKLSGGQQQRVAIARAIVTHPLLLLADEPTGSLDSKRSVEIMELLTDLNKSENITVVLVTHESDMAVYARRCIHFLDGLVASDEIQPGR